MKKYRLAAIFISAICFFALPHDSSAQKTDHNCMKCHKITVDEVAKLVKNDLPGAKILEVREAPVKGLVEVVYEVEVEKQKRNGLFYLDSTAKFLIARGDIIDLKAKKSLTSTRLKTLNMANMSKVDRSKIPLKNALILGDKKAKNKVIVFTDPYCPFCKKLHDELKSVVEKRKDIAFYIKLYPIKQLHPAAYDKTRTIICKKSLALLEDVFKGKEIPAADCDTNEADENIKLAAELGIKGTPAIVFPNGNLWPGYLDADSIINAVDNKKTENKESKNK